MVLKIKPCFSTESKIRNFIKVIYDAENAYHMYDNKLGYVLIVGDAKGAINGGQVPNFGVPTSYFCRGHWANNWGNDFFYTCVTEENDNFDDVGDLFIGRFCVRTETELQNIVTKTKHFENEFDNTNDWRKSYMQYNDASSIQYPEQFLYPFQDYLQDIIISPYNLEILDQFIIGQQDMREAVRDALNGGKSYVRYNGHSNYDRYSVGISPGLNYFYLTNQLDNDYRTPFVFNYTCLSGKFYFDNQLYPEECLSAYMTTYSSENGFVGCLASTELQGMINNFNGPISLGSGLIHDRISNTLSHVTGEFILEAKNISWRKYERSQLNYFGDPALNLFAHGYEVTKNLNLSNEVTISTPVYVRSGYSFEPEFKLHSVFYRQWPTDH
ncbi:MAG: C25 family cysteine peptidase [Bacteroidota bacterium]|nr:C25 family cysteine peptidase [Bacteroidota bacterium]